MIMCECDNDVPHITVSIINEMIIRSVRPFRTLMMTMMMLLLLLLLIFQCCSWSNFSWLSIFTSNKNATVVFSLSRPVRFYYNELLLTLQFSRRLKHEGGKKNANHDQWRLLGLSRQLLKNEESKSAQVRKAARGRNYQKEDAQLNVKKGNDKKALLLLVIS